MSFLTLGGLGADFEFTFTPNYGSDIVITPTASSTQTAAQQKALDDAIRICGEKWSPSDVRSEDGDSQFKAYGACHAHYLKNQDRVRALGAGTLAYAQAERERIAQLQAASQSVPPPAPKDYSSLSKTIQKNAIEQSTPRTTAQKEASAQQQIAMIRAQQQRASSSFRTVFTGTPSSQPRPMTEPQQIALITQTAQGGGLGTGMKIALAVGGTIVVLGALAALLGKR